MPRGYRGVILASLGCLILGAAPPRNSASAKQDHTNHEIAASLRQLDATIKQANETGELNKPCQKQERNRASQLCAQWQAADQSQRAADWAGRGFWLTLIGLVLGLLTLVAAGAAAWFAKSASDAANKSYEAFVRTEDASLVISFPTGSHSMASGRYELRATISNIGRSAALIRAVYLDGGSPLLLNTILKADGKLPIDDFFEFDGNPSDQMTIKFSVEYASALKARTKLTVDAAIMHDKEVPNHVWGFLIGANFEEMGEDGKGNT